MLNIVLFGPPGAGKGTQSKKIIEKYNLMHISTGDLFRKHMCEGTELGCQAQKYMDDGNLVPDDIVIKMVELRIHSEKDPHGFIFDGFPRTVKQAEALDEMLANSNLRIYGMISLDVPEDELRTRIRKRGKYSGRADDQDDEKINTRIKVYHEETVPVASYYENQGKLQSINGLGTVDGIFEDVSNAIDMLTAQKV